MKNRFLLVILMKRAESIMTRQENRGFREGITWLIRVEASNLLLRTHPPEAQGVFQHLKIRYEMSR